MDLIEFPEQTVVIAKDQPEYRPLPAYRYQDQEGTIAFCWSLNWRERLQVLLTGRLWHRVLTFSQPLQPQLLTAEKPAMPPHEFPPDRAARPQGVATEESNPTRGA